MEYTKYEKARIIGARALQLAYGAPPLVEVPKGTTDPIKLAELEFNAGVIPIVILR
ncbi:MAG: DNA-directed RNA polymerase subunit K [Candidatus Micrarchaeia archaeon]